MEEIWEYIKTLPRGSINIRGETPLKEAAGCAFFRVHLERADLDEGQIDGVAKLVIRMAPNFKDVSALRKTLRKNPKELTGVDETEIRTLLVLFIDKRTAAEYK